MIIEVDGQRFEVPDDATPAEIAQITARPLEARLQQSLPDPQPIDKGEAALRALSSLGTAGIGTLTFGQRPASRMSGFEDQGAIRDPQRRAELVQEQQAADAQALREHPFISMAAGGPAAVMAAPFLGGAQAPAMGARFLQALKLGAGMGAVGGLTRSTDAAQIPGNVAQDAAAGAVLGPLVQGGAEAAGAGFRAVQPWLREVALEQGRKALTGNAGTISVKKALSPESVTAAYETGGIRPGASVKGIAQRLTNTRDELGNRYGELVSDLAAAGIEGPRVSKAALELSDAARNMTQTANPAPGMYRDLALQLSQEPAAQATGRLPLEVAEQIKRNLQNAARAEYVKEGTTSLAGDAKRELASFVRQSVEDAISEQAAKAPELAASFVPVKQRLGAVIEASNAADIAAARAARKSNLGLVPAVAASGGLASGGIPAAVAAGTAAKVAQTRGPATVGWIAHQLGRVEPTATPAMAGARSTALSEYLQAVLEALRAPRLRLTPAAADQESK